MTRRRALLLVSASLPCALILWLSTCPDRYHATARREWKEDALARLRAEHADKAGLKARLTQTPAPDDSVPWLRGSLIVCANGDWVLCRNACQKEDWRVHDIFLCCASDGGWYYSTFHFCRNLCVLQIQGQPQSLAQFKFDYCLQPFDGRSDACLKPTWPLPVPR